MKLSILDQAPISKGQTPSEALEASRRLAVVGDAYGYTRFWMAEHHALPSIASSAPEVVLGYIGAFTKRIRVGSGATLLPYYKPYKVAESFNMLATLFEDRVDIGIGRAPGGPAEASEALSDGFLQQVFKMPDLVDELIGYMDKGGTLPVNPVPPIEPALWMLGTSRKSAAFAAKKGLSYCFGQFMSEEDGKEILEHYRENFRARKKGQAPQTIMGVSVVCAETTEAAYDIASSWLAWQVQQSRGEDRGIPSIEEAKSWVSSVENEERMNAMRDKMIIGNPKEVVEALIRLQKATDVDEFMIITITFSPEDKRASYRYIAEALDKR